MTRTFLIRHGESTYNASEEVLDERDADITPFGVLQLRYLLAKQTEIIIRPKQTVYLLYSPLKRAVSTKEIIKDWLLSEYAEFSIKIIEESTSLLRERRLAECDFLKEEALLDSLLETEDDIAHRVGLLKEQILHNGARWSEEEDNGDEENVVIICVTHADLVFALTSYWMDNGEVIEYMPLSSSSSSNSSSGDGEQQRPKEEDDGCCRV
jgi:broad specificity phosphatase PhoE